MNAETVKRVVADFRRNHPVTAGLSMTGRPPGLPKYSIWGLDFFQSCLSCPEQHEVFYGEHQVGYLRLRHGHFRVDVPACGGKAIYIAEPIGEDEFHRSERWPYLTMAARVILEYYANEGLHEQ